MRTFSKMVWVVAALATTGIPGVAVFGADGANSAAVSAATELQTAPVVNREVDREYRLDGVVEAVNQGTVSAQTQGVVEEVTYDVDDFVERDAVIARIRDTEHRARVAQAAAQMKAAVANLDRAREERGRVAGLFKSKNASDSDMDRADAELASAEAGLEAAQAALEQAQEQLNYTVIRAPYSGLVTGRLIEVGEMASPGSGIMSGISLDSLRVVVDVPQSMIAAVRKFGKARVLQCSGDELESGEITVFPYAEEGSKSFRVRLELTGEHADIFPGMCVKTVFVIGREEKILIPLEAVVHRSEVTGAYVIDQDGTVGFRQIRTGRDFDGEACVLAGLSEGERVALDPHAAAVLLKRQTEARRAAGEAGHD